MDPILISNPVYDSIQVPTLEEEPSAKSTILYANRYSGINEVELQDPELLAIIESTVGLSGNNVLVQLKNKMATFRNGPWYIDSRNGVIYIHNRKYSRDSVYQYTYQYENGELLSASFRMVEVRSDISGLGGFVNAVSKAIGVLQSRISSIGDYPTYPEIGSPSSIERPVLQKTAAQWHSEYMEAMQYPFDINMQAFREGAQRVAEHNAMVKGKYYEYKAQSSKEKNAKLDKEYTARYDSISEEDMWKMLNNVPGTGGNPRIHDAFELWKARCAQFGRNSVEAKAAEEELIKESKSSYLKVPSVGPDWREATVWLTTDEFVMPGDKEPYDEIIQRHIRNRIERFKRSGRFTDISHETVESYELVYCGTDYTSDATMGDFSGRTSLNKRWKVKFRLMFFGYGSATRRMSGERFIRGLIDRYPKNSDPASIIRNAAANIGRGKMEKRLQATIRVVGNPILELGQQLDIQNVGTKHSGLWYIHKITHTLEFGQGYTTDITLSRQMPKANVNGTYSEVHTQSYTVDNEPTNPNTFKRSGFSTTSSKPRSKANVVPGNEEFTYEDAMAVPFTLDEQMYARELYEEWGDEALAEFTRQVADNNYYNYHHGTSNKVVTYTYDVEGNRKPVYKNPNYTRAQVQRTKITQSNNFDLIKKTTNRNK